MVHLFSKILCFSFAWNKKRKVMDLGTFIYFQQSFYHFQEYVKSVVMVYHSCRLELKVMIKETGMPHKME